MDLEEHLRQEHKVGPLDQYLEEIVYGGIDGIVTTFAVVAGFAGAGGQIDGKTTIMAVLLFGLANLFADGFSMGLGNFLSLRSAQDMYRSHRRKEEREIQLNPDAEGKETVEILIQKGFTKDDAKEVLKLYKKNPKYWTDFMMNHELKLPNTTEDTPFINGVVTFLSFVFFGFIPLIPYVFYFKPNDEFDNFSLLFSAILFTSLALLLLGTLRKQVTQISLFRSLAETYVVGAFSGGIAYAIGTLFQV